MTQEIQSPQFWHESFGNSYKNFLFEHPLAKERLMAIVASGDNAKIFPLYMLCYLFDNNKLTNAELFQNINELTVLYSLHVVGLVTKSLNKTAIIADQNGPLNGGSNLEFLTMKLQSKPTTILSCYDRMERKQIKNITVEELNAERKGKQRGFKRNGGLEFNKPVHSLLLLLSYRHFFPNP